MRKKNRNTRISGHSGLPEEVELRMMAEKLERLEQRKEQRYKEMVAKMNSLGIAPFERRRFFIGFIKWLEEQEGAK